MARTYGLGGGGLAGVGMQQQAQAADMLGRAAEQEQSRNLANEQLGRQRKAGNAQLGASAGAMAGFAMTGGNPVGAMVGSLLGAVGGSLF